MENTEKAYEIYVEKGQDGVFSAAHNGTIKIDKWDYCEPCEYDSPIYENCCLVCGNKCI